MTSHNDDGEPTTAAIQETFEKEGPTLTVARLSVLLGQDRNTTYRMLNSGEIPAIRLDDRWLIFTSAVKLWLINKNKKDNGGKK